MARCTFSFAYLGDLPWPTLLMPLPSELFPFAIIGFVALLFVVGIGWYIVANLPILSVYEFGTQAFYILLVILALAAAIFLFGFLRSTATLTGRHIGIAFQFGGPAALFAFVILIGVFLLQKEQTDFALTVRLRTDDNRTMASAFTEPAVTASTLTMDLGPVARTQNLDRDGQVVVLAVPFRVRSSNEQYRYLRMPSFSKSQKDPIRYPLVPSRQSNSLCFPNPKRKNEFSLRHQR